MAKFKLVSKYQPTGDQPSAIRQLTDGVFSGVKEQTLLGVTGSGKTFTMANIIQNVQKPTMKYTILYRTLIIISQRPILLQPILILRRIRQLTTKLIDCGMAQRRLY